MNGEWTEKGKHTRETLEKTLSGIRYQRGFLGKWVAAEGQVYGEFDHDKHVINKLPDISGWTKYRAIDFGWFILLCVFGSREILKMELSSFIENGGILESW